MDLTDLTSEDLFIEEIKKIITEYKIDLKEFEILYDKKDFDGLFKLSIHYDIIELTEYLYENKGVRFYLSDYIKIMNKDLYEELNSEIKRKGYTISIFNPSTESYKYLLYNRRYSKLNKDDKGFYYVFNKR
jgi:hypothetical protein